MADTTTPTTALNTPAATRTIREILGLHDLLVFLGDGHVELIRDADGQLILDKEGNVQRGKVTPFSLGLRARYAVLRNRTATEKVAKRVQKLRDDRINELSAGKGKLTKENADEIKLVQDELDALLAETETISLHQVPIEDLRLDANALITDSIILALGDLVSAPAA